MKEKFFFGDLWRFEKENSDLACFTSLKRLLLAACCWRADNNPTVITRDCNHCHRACHVLSAGMAVDKSADLKSALSVKKEISSWVGVFWNTHPAFVFWQFELIHERNCYVSTFPEKVAQSLLHRIRKDVYNLWKEEVNKYGGASTEKVVSCVQQQFKMYSCILARQVSQSFWWDNWRCGIGTLPFSRYTLLFQYATARVSVSRVIWFYHKIFSLVWDSLLKVW